LIVCGICLAIGFLHLALFLRLSEQRSNLWFAVMCFSVAAGAFFEAAAYQASEVGTYNVVYKWQVTSQGLLWIAMVWFIAGFTGAARRWTAFAVTAAYVAAVLINLFSPFGILYDRIDALKATTLPWNESIVIAVGPANAWRVVADIGWLLLIYLVIECCIRLYRSGRKRRALFISASLLLCLGPAYIHGTLVDLGVLAPPFYVSFAFLTLLVIMSSTIVGEVVRASKLNREILVAERRWRDLLENVQLLVIGIDNQGTVNYVNPHFLKISGYSPMEVLGKPLVDTVPPEDRQAIRARFNRAMQGQIRTQVKRYLLTKVGLKRLINWSHVVVRDTENQIAGTLSIGEDVTQLNDARRALEDEKSRMDIILSSLNTGLALINRDMTVAWVNEKRGTSCPGKSWSVRSVMKPPPGGSNHVKNAERSKPFQTGKFTRPNDIARWTASGIISFRCRSKTTGAKLFRCWKQLRI